MSAMNRKIIVRHAIGAEVLRLRLGAPENLGRCVLFHLYIDIIAFRGTGHVSREIGTGLSDPTRRHT